MVGCIFSRDRTLSFIYRRIRVNVRLRPGHGLPHGTRVELGADIFFEDGTRVQEQYQVR